MTCPSCHTPFADHQRYCLRCGALVGARSIDLERAWAIAREAEVAEAADTGVVEGASPAGAPTPTPTPTPTSAWRRPAASLLTAAALAAGVLGGFLLGPDGGFADRGRGPVLLGGLGAAVAPASSAVPGAEAGAASSDAPPAIDDNSTDLTPAADAGTADASASPSASDDTSPASTGDDLGSGTDLSGVADDTSAGTGTSGDDTTDTGSSGDGSTDLSGLVSGAGSLPAIEHVWVISVTGQDYAALFGTESGYLADVLASRGTLLSHYTPAGGAQALLTGLDAATPGAATLLSQLEAKDKSWRAYVEDGGAAACTAPASARTPFATGADCATDVVGLDRLTTDLATADTIPALSWIVPGTGDDGSAPAGTPALDRFLERIVAPIRRTTAYRSGGLIAIVPDAGSGTTPAPVATGALLLSPFVAHATAVDTAVGPPVLLRTLEDLFSLDPLGHAGDDGVSALGSDVWENG
jgi:hypothetical protein